MVQSSGGSRGKKSVYLSSTLNAEPPFDCEPLGIEPFDELRVSSSVEKLEAEMLRSEWLNTRITRGIETVINVDAKVKQISNIFVWIFNPPSEQRMRFPINPPIQRPPK